MTMLLSNSLLSLISILVSVAFYTMLERKILSYIQTRKGPNKVGVLGILQPFSDAIKLFNKTLITPTNSNSMFFMITPAISLMLSLMMLPCLPLASFNILDSPLNTLIFILISSMSVYTIMMMGWSSNSKYSHLGAIRSIAQMISYEINFLMIILIFIITSHSYNLSSLMLSQLNLWFIMGMSILLTAWTMSCIAEVNRSPFDFAESESELVSGFNTEFMGGPFALIFLSEYTNMLTLAMISALLFTGTITTKTSILFTISMAILLIWARGTLPRLRYDMLMHMNWKHLLPLTTLTLILIFMLISILF